MFCRRRFALPVLIALFVSALHTLNLRAQTNPSGRVYGTVTDPSGAVIAEASISLASPENPVLRRATTLADGSFDFTGLPSGTYTLKISAPGFAPYQNDSIAVAVGRTARIDVRLAPARATQQITVPAQTSALDTTQTSPVTNIDRDRIEELPVPSRNYLNFALLSPQLSAANPAFALNTPGAEQTGFSSGGLRPSSNAIYIDGVDDNDEYTGLSRTELSPEAISDFQIVNHGYAAQSGGSAGGSVDVETRSGAQLQHGDAFLFIQNGALNATPPLEFVPRKPDENRLRAGLSTGGALARSGLFYYLAAEQEMARGEESSDFTPQLAAQIDSALALSGPLHNFRIQQGFFPTTNQETEFSSRVDRAFSRDSFMVRYALTNNRSVNDAFNLDDLTDLSSRGSAFFSDNSINGSWTSTFSPRFLNQLDFQVSQRRAALRTSSTTAPGIVVAGIANLGTPFTGNSRRYETHVDLGDALTLQHHAHLFQSGASFSHIALRDADREGFAGLYVFPTLASVTAAQPDFYLQSFGNPLTNLSELRIAAFVQDHWTPTRSLAFDYGLRYEANLLPSSFHQDPDNLSPRFGFAWSPDKNLVLRGGFGLFYDRYLLSTINRIRQFDGTHAFQQIAEGPTSAAFYQSGLAFAAPQPGIAPSIWQSQPRLSNPYSETASLGIERALLAQWTLSAEYRFVHGIKLGRTLNVNLPPPVLLTAANAGTLGIPSPAPQQLGQLIFPPQRLDPAYDSINQFQTEADSSYNGLTLALNRQFTEDFELLAGYTLSRTTDDASYDTEQPQNPYALHSERAPSLNGQRNRFVLSGLWVLGPDLDDPQDRARASTPNTLQKIIYGLEFAPILSASSGFPDNPVTGIDSNREHIYPFATRPLGRSRNSIHTPPAVNLDLRILRMVPIWRGHLDIVAESFNLPNRQNVQLINPAYGPSLSPAPSFTQPIQNSEPRRLQFSLDFEY